MRHTLALTILLNACASAPKADATNVCTRTAPDPAQHAMLTKGMVFATRFEEPEATGSPRGALDMLSFTNLASPEPSQWQLPSPVTIRPYYEDGDASDRWVRFAQDPLQPGNRLLELGLQNAAIAVGARRKGRVSTRFHPMALGHSMTELWATQRVCLHPDFALVPQYDRADNWWLSVTFQELWMGHEATADPYDARLGLILGDAGDGELGMYVHMTDRKKGENLWTDVWGVYVDRRIPVGSWFTLTIGYRQGDDTSGRVVLQMAEDGSEEIHTLVDVTDWTFSPRAPEPVGLVAWNPQKIYSSHNIVDFVRDEGGVLRIYFDDFGFADRWPKYWPGKSE